VVIFSNDVVIYCDPFQQRPLLGSNDGGLQQLAKAAELFADNLVRGGGMDALACGGLVLHPLKLGAERCNSCICLGHRRSKSVGLELQLGFGLCGVVGVQKRLERVAVVMAAGLPSISSSSSASR
jgi:hypothetical protein